MRNPLDVIRSSNFYLKRKLIAPDEKISKHIRRIEEQVDLCVLIIADLLEYTHGGHVELRRQAIIPWMAHLVDQLKESEEIDIRLEILGDLPPIPHDKEKMNRVLINLLDNAIQAVRDKQVASGDSKGASPYRPDIVLKVFTSDENLVIQISDHGIGMDEDTCRRAMEPLFTTRARGTGIGLAIVGKIVREHCGQIRLNCSKGRGTTATITLPGCSDKSAPETPQR